MAVRIRMSRMGAKKDPKYMIVATDGASKRDGAFIEKIGQYFPKARNLEERLVVKTDLLIKWHVEHGAQMSETVANLVRPLLKKK